ncbi:FAD-dependent monooxygenase [Mucilaginibacter sp. CSA2-8R]|uniref:FAD-dependent monooxygenase n=1 Tax=Mucilaginibacter sp. CSA2-8R TaxID=3141542 RepID=UPI00315D3227
MTPVAQSPTQVLIVGAGPSGLMMAAQLLRYGLQPVIIDNRQGPTRQSRALAVQARSLEIYRQLGIVDTVIAEGFAAAGVNFYDEGEQKASFAIQNTGQDETPFPFVHIYPQNKNERTLLNYLTDRSCPVYWNTSLTDLQQQPGEVKATLSNGEQHYTLTCQWLIGADGAHSQVRKQLQIRFNGDTYHSRFYLADVIMPGNEKLINIYLAPRDFAAFFPMPGQGAYRIVGNIPPELVNKPEFTLADVLPALKKITGSNLPVLDCTWFTTYQLHHRMAVRFSLGRCFLIGDAAHIHSPIGGQGMNTGLQDAYNLAWKLAGVIQNKLKPEILNSYAAERMPVAKDLLQSTDRAFKIIISDSLWARPAKKWLLPVLLRKAWQNEALRFKLFKRVSQTGISYTHSSLNLHLSQLTTIKAGDRLPYLKIYDEKKQQQTDLHAWCGKPGFTLITMGLLQELYVFSLAKWITQNYNGWLNFYHLPPSVKNQRVFDTFGINAGQSKALIVRPDMHIGFINDVVDLEMMKNYLENVAGCIPYPTSPA